MANIIIKKQFQDLINFLVENKDKKVASILEATQNMCSAKYSRSASGNAVLRDSEGNLVAILCAYFKRWMPLVGESAVLFGDKAKTSTGLNSTCKAGMQVITAHAKVAREASAALLGNVAAGSVAPENIIAEQEKIETERLRIEATDLGFEDKDALLLYLADNDVTVAEPVETPAE